MLSKNSTIPSNSVSVAFVWLFINVTAKNVPAKLPISGNKIFLQLTWRSIVANTNIDVRAPSMEDSMFASVNSENICGKNIMANMPNPNPVTLCMKLPHMAIAAINKS